jgi:hypothetical protein
MALLGLGLMALASDLDGANGDVLSISTALKGKSVVALTKGRDSTFFVLGSSGVTADAHRIYHLGTDLQQLLDTVENPHPPGSIPGNDLTLNRGIAFHSLNRTLFVLASVGPREAQSYQVKEVQPVPAPGFLGLSFTVVPPDANANLFGLAFDVLKREFWTFDIENDKLIRFDLAGQIKHVFDLPGRTHSAAEIRGQGISYDLEIVGQEALPLIYTTYGDVFRREASKVIQLRGEGVPQDNGFVGVRTGIEIPLDAIPVGDLRGIYLNRFGVQRRLLVLAASGEIYQLEQVISDPIPPSELVCNLTINNQVRLSWRNHGSSGPGAPYAGFVQVLRNGVPVTKLAGSADSFIDRTPIQGTSSYSLQAAESEGGPLSAPGLPCEVTVGTGGLVNWTTSPGAAVFDLARDPESGTIFATDNLLGRIFAFDAELAPTGEIPSPWSDPGAIAFVSSIDLGFPPQTFTNLLAVARVSGRQIAFIDLDGEERTSFSLNLPMENPQVASLSFIPAEQRFAMQEAGSGKIFVVDSQGRVVYSCLPSFVIGIPYGRGIASGTIEDSYLATFSGGSVKEIYLGENCAPAIGNFGFELSSLGEGFDSPNFFGGIEAAGNTLLVAGMESNAIFQVLIFPFEASFIRGDFDGDSEVIVTDAIVLAEYLFRVGPSPECLDAADVNDDGLLDVADPVYLLFHLFLGRPAPPAPYPSPGRDPTFRDSIGCAQ